MLILQPTSGDKIITIAPRSSNLSGVFVLNIRRDGDGKEESITNSTLSNIVNFTEVTFQSTILEEDSTYYLEITKDSELWYRDKIYVTSQTASERVNNKHEIGNGTIYKPYSTIDDNTYIINDIDGVAGNPDGSTEGSTGGNTGGSTGNAPQISDTSFRTYSIKIGSNYSLRLSANNGVDSWSIETDIEGLEISDNGILFGVVSGDVRTDTVTVTATNENGSDSVVIEFDINNEDIVVTSVPVIIYDNDWNIYIPLDEPFSWQIEATNEPKSYNVVGIIDGLSIDSSTGLISGQVTGEEKSYSMIISATNDIGTTTRTIKFRTTNDSVDEFLPPYSLNVVNETANGFKLTWELRGYNGTIVSAEIFRQGVLYQEYIYDGDNINGSQNNTDITNSYGEHNWTIRLKNSLGEYSDFSDTLTYSNITTEGGLPYNESVIPVNPTLDNVVAYYKMEADYTSNGGIIIDETGNHNGYPLGNVQRTAELSFNNSLFYTLDNSQNAASVVIPSSPELSFTDDTNDKPFSFNLWFKLYGDGKGFYTLIRKGDLYNDGSDYEFRLFYEDYTSNGSNNQTVQFSLELNDLSAETNFKDAQTTLLGLPSELDISTDEWNHLVVTNNGKSNNEYGSTVFYINGKYKVSQSQPPSFNISNDYQAMQSSEKPLTIGNYGRPNDYAITEDNTQVIGIDEVIIFDKVLNKDEVNFLYNNRQGNVPT